jgi:hypothetical protein
MKSLRDVILSITREFMSDDERAADRWQNEGGKVKGRYLL